MYCQDQESPAERKGVGSAWCVGSWVGGAYRYERASVRACVVKWGPPTPKLSTLLSTRQGDHSSRYPMFFFVSAEICRMRASCSNGTKFVLQGSEIVQSGPPPLPNHFLVNCRIEPKAVSPPGSLPETSIAAES